MRSSQLWLNIAFFCCDSFCKFFVFVSDQTGDCVLHGIMYKLGGQLGITTWQKKYFYLFPNRLEWVDQETSVRPFFWHCFFIFSVLDFRKRENFAGKWACKKVAIRECLFHATKHFTINNYIPVRIFPSIVSRTFSAKYVQLLVSVSTRINLGLFQFWLSCVSLPKFLEEYPIFNVPSYGRRSVLYVMLPN